MSRRAALNAVIERTIGMNVPGCTWVRASGQRVVHITRGRGVTFCCRRLRKPIAIRELKPDVLIQYSGDDCMNCLRIFNALVCEPETKPAAESKPSAAGE